MLSNKIAKLLASTIIFILYNFLLRKFQSNLIYVLGIDNYNIIVYGAYFIVGIASSYFHTGAIYLFFTLILCISLMTIFITGLHSYSVIYAFISILLGFFGYWILFLGGKLKKYLKKIS